MTKANSWKMFVRMWKLIIPFLFLSVSLEAIPRAAINSFALEGTYLYLRPISDFPYYAALRSDTTNRMAGPRFANQFDFDSGYGIEGSYTWSQCEYDIRGRWTHFASSTSASLPFGNYISTEAPVPGPALFLSPTVPHNHRSLDYDAFDLLLGYSFFDHSSIFTCNLGLHWAKLSLSDEFHFSRLNPGVGETRGTLLSNMHGIGPEVGLMGKWQLPFTWNSWLFLNGKLEGALLFSRINSSRNVFTEQPTIAPFVSDISNAHVTSMVPHWAFSLSMSSELQYSCHCFSAELGYTMMGYYHALDFIAFAQDLVFASPIVANTFDRRDSIYFHGLFVMIGIAY